MTMGELARLFNARLAIGADLHVVPRRGWRREPGGAHVSCNADTRPCPFPITIEELCP